MWSGSETGSYWLIEVVYHSTLGLRVIHKGRRGIYCYRGNNAGMTRPPESFPRITRKVESSQNAGVGIKTGALVRTRE